MSTEAPLHPRRIAVALRTLELERKHDEKVFDSEVAETFEAALKLIQKTQRATGLTPEIADVGAHMLGMVDYVKKGFLGK